MRFDYVIRDADGRARAVVEVKKRPKASASWARELRDNLLHYVRSRAGDAFFAVVTPDDLYIWPSSSMHGTDPIAIPMKSLLDPYFARAGTSSDAISAEGFELLVGSWLGDLVRGAPAPGFPRDLLESIRQGEVANEEDHDSEGLRRD